MHRRELAEGERVKERRPPEPAPLPLHALLSMQQGAGNQAVGRFLARAKYKPSEVRSEVKEAMNPRKGAAPGSKTALLLAIYNEMRHRMEKTPDAFATIKKATDTLKGVGYIDDEDIAAFERAATLEFASDSDLAKILAEELKAEIKLKRPSIDAKHKHHIFQGDYKSDKESPTGYHSIKGAQPSATHEAYGTKTDVANDAPGVYQQSVRSKKAPFKKKEYRSTFFPDDATEDDVLDAITSVYGVTPQASTVQYPAKLRGMTLQTIGATVFPAGGKDLDPE